MLGCAGGPPEEADSLLLDKITRFTLNSEAVFCINSIVDLLAMADIFSGDPYRYRINTPGTISQKNWSLRLPIGLEQLLKHPLNEQIRGMVADSGRAC
jgi:4-alpha-glucanotransferase